MPAGQDTINFEFSEDWELAVNVSRAAQIVGENSYIPIASFDLGVSLNNSYVAVIAGTASGKPSWFLAGDVAQVYDFAKGGNNPVTGKIEPLRTRLAINRLQLIDATRVSTDSYRLRYSPPAWFRDCTIKVYKYVGEKRNFVEDALFDIGNALGVDPNNPDGKLILALLRIEDLIKESEARLCAKIEALEGGGGTPSGGGGFGFTGGGEFQAKGAADNSGLGFFTGFL